MLLPRDVFFVERVTVGFGVSPFIGQIKRKDKGVVYGAEKGLRWQESILS